MVRDEKCDNCDCCGLHCCHTAKNVVGIALFIVVLLLVFWLVRFVLGVAFGIASQASSVLSLAVEIVVFLAVFLFVVWIIKLPFRFMYGGFGRRDIRILRRRYASGEISEAQFKRMMKNLKAHY